MSTLKRKAFGAVIWSAVDRLSGQLVRFGIGIALARLLLPSEFGLVGMLTVFMGISQVFVNCGFGEALIQKQDTTRQDESSVFYLNVMMGAITGGILYAAAPLIAQFYGQPSLVQLSRFMALDIVIISFGVVQTMLLTKKLDFKTQIKISVTSTVISGGIAIVLAWRGFGVMSLIAQILIGDFLSTLMLWFFKDWRPLPSFSWASLRQMFPYGSRLMASGLLNSVFGEIHSVVIGRLYDPSTLGFFSRARQMQALPLDNLGAIVSRVSFPVFAAIHADKDALKRGVRKACRGLVWLNFPLMVGLALTAGPLVRVLLTEKWLACVPYIRLLCVSGALYPLSLIHVNVLSAQGRSDLFLKLEIIKKVLIVVVVVATYRYGVTGLLTGNIGVACAAYYLNSHYSVRLFHYSWKEQISDLLPYGGLSAVMGVAVYLAGFLPWSGVFQALVAQVAIGTIVYAAGSWYFRVVAFSDACELLGKPALGQKSG